MGASAAQAALGVRRRCRKDVSRMEGEAAGGKFAVLEGCRVVLASCVELPAELNRTLKRHTDTA
eukprot:1998821-Rhodomonas_salina.1